jgi:hypothetical protein
MGVVRTTRRLVDDQRLDQLGPRSVDDDHWDLGNSAAPNRQRPVERRLFALPAAGATAPRAAGTGSRIVVPNRVDRYVTAVAALGDPR